VIWMFAAMFLFGAGVAVLAMLIVLWVALMTGDEP
jgi:hypothetical protein